MTTVAAIDCGTNSTRLLVSEDGRTVERLMRITRLGQGVDATGRLAPEAIDRTTAVLAEYREVMDRHGVERVRMTATSAARDAANREDFFAAAEAVVGTRPELLSGLEEGRLSFAGATADLDPADVAGRQAVVDGEAERARGVGGHLVQAGGRLHAQLGDGHAQHLPQGVAIEPDGCRVGLDDDAGLVVHEEHRRGARLEQGEMLHGVGCGHSMLWPIHGRGRSLSRDDANACSA